MLTRNYNMQQPISTKNYYVEISEEILLRARSGQDTTSHRRQLFYISYSKIEKSLDTDALKKAFWINIYNAFYLIILRDKKNNGNIYGIKRIKVARSLLSLNDIEHGILRKTKFRWGLGYLTNPFYSKFIKSIAVHKVDYRIHFAIRSMNLNPASIDYFNSEEIEEQLSTVAADFIKLETEFKHSSKKIILPQFLLTNLLDFGGMQGIKNLLELIYKRDFKGYTLRFKPHKREEKTIKGS